MPVLDPDVTVTWKDGAVSRAYLVSQGSMFKLSHLFSGSLSRSGGAWLDLRVPLVPELKHDLPGVEWVSVPEGGYLLETKLRGRSEAFMGVWESSLEGLIEWWQGLGPGHEIAEVRRKEGA